MTVKFITPLRVANVLILRTVSPESPETELLLASSKRTIQRPEESCIGSAMR